jgi:hypothetical protein
VSKAKGKLEEALRLGTAHLGDVDGGLAGGTGKAGKAAKEKGAPRKETPEQKKSRLEKEAAARPIKLDSAEEVRLAISSPEGLARLQKQIGTNKSKMAAARSALYERNRAWAEDFDKAMGAKAPVSAPSDDVVGLGAAEAVEMPGKVEDVKAPARELGDGTRIDTGKKDSKGRPVTRPGITVDGEQIPVRRQPEARAPITRLGETSPFMSQKIPDRALSLQQQWVRSVVRDYLRKAKPLDPATKEVYKLNDFLAQAPKEEIDRITLGQVGPDAWKAEEAGALRAEADGSVDPRIVKIKRKGRETFVSPFSEKMDNVSERAHESQELRHRDTAVGAAGTDPASFHRTERTNADDGLREAVAAASDEVYAPSRSTQTALSRSHDALIALRNTYPNSTELFQKLIDADDATASELAHQFAHDINMRNFPNTERVSPRVSRDAVKGTAYALLEAAGKQVVADAPSVVAKDLDAVAATAKSDHGRPPAAPMPERVPTAPLTIDQPMYGPTRGDFQRLESQRDPVNDFFTPDDRSVAYGPLREDMSPPVDRSAPQKLPLPPIPQPKPPRTRVARPSKAAPAAEEAVVEAAEEAAPTPAGKPPRRARSSDVTSSAPTDVTVSNAAAPSATPAPSAASAPLGQRFQALAERAEASDGSDLAEIAAEAKQLDAEMRRTLGSYDVSPNIGAAAYRINEQVKRLSGGADAPAKAATPAATKPTPAKGAGKPPAEPPAAPPAAPAPPPPPRRRKASDLVDTAPTDVTVRPNLDDPALFHGEDIGLFHTEPALSVPEKPAPKARRTPVRARAAKEPYGPPAPYGPPRPPFEDAPPVDQLRFTQDAPAWESGATRDPSLDAPWLRHQTEQLRGTQAPSEYVPPRNDALDAAQRERARFQAEDARQAELDSGTARTGRERAVAQSLEQDALAADALDMAARDMDAEGGMAPTTPTGWHSDVNWSTPLFQVGDAVEHQGLKLPADQGFRFQMPPPPDYIPRDTKRLPPLPPEPTAPAPRPLVTPRDILVPAAAGLGVGTALSFSNVNAPESEPMPSDLQRLDRVQQAIRALRGGAL